MISQNLAIIFEANRKSRQKASEMFAEINAGTQAVMCAVAFRILNRCTLNWDNTYRQTCRVQSTSCVFFNPPASWTPWLLTCFLFLSMVQASKVARMRKEVAALKAQLVSLFVQQAYSSGSNPEATTQAAASDPTQLASLEVGHFRGFLWVERGPACTSSFRL